MKSETIDNTPPNLNILIVEDEIIIAISEKQALERAGHQVLGVFSRAEDAIRSLSEHKPDLILMDISLKGKLTGIDAAEIITLTYDIPVLFLTGQLGDSIKEGMKAAREHTVLFKPFDNAELTRAVELAYTRYKKKDNFRERCSEITYKRINGKKSFLKSLDDMIERLSESIEKSQAQNQFTDFLKEINSSFSELVSSGQDLSLLMIDSEGAITYANENFGLLFGFANRDLMYKNINELLDQESQDKFSFLLKHDSFKLPKGVFLDLKCRNVNNRYLDVNCFMEERQDDSGHFYFGIIMAQQKGFLYGGEDVLSEENSCNVLGSYLEDLRRNLSEALDLTDSKYTSNTNQRLRKSIFNLIAYSDYLTNDFENLEISEIRELAGRINVYLKNINELLYGEEMGVMERQRIN